MTTFYLFFFFDRIIKKAKLFDMACKFFLISFWGYHYYKIYWKQLEHQTLGCMHEKLNPFSFFAKNVMEQKSGRTVGQLPMENSRAAKFILDLGASNIAKLTSCSYCILSLVQEGLEILCQVETYMAATLKNQH